MSSGYDPEVHYPCSFDDCRTRRIHKFTYNNGCKTVITPGGTFKIPDQITVLNKYETTAHTDIYQSEKELDYAIAAHANMATGVYSAAMRANYNNKGSDTEHTAVRKINVKLYTLYVETINTYSAGFEGIEKATISMGGLTPTVYTERQNFMFARHRNMGLDLEFVEDASALPLRFGDDSNAFFRFLRKWGR